jgi:outer membrane protein W
MLSFKCFSFYPIVFVVIIVNEVQSSDVMTPAPNPGLPNPVFPLPVLKMTKVQDVGQEDQGAKVAQPLKEEVPAQGSPVAKEMIPGERESHIVKEAPKIAEKKDPQAVKDQPKEPAQPIILNLKEIKTEQGGQQPTENQSMSLAEDRKPWTITVKPLSVNFSAVTFGMTKKKLRVNQFDVDSHRSSFGYLANRSERAGVGYDLELGLMVTKNIEVFTILGFSYERPFEKVTMLSPSFNLSFDFKVRRSFELSLGGRYYWDLQNRWSPFVGIMGTGIFQEPIKSEAFTGTAPNYKSIGNFTFIDRTTMWGGAIQGGADYQFTKKVLLSLSVSLRYTPRTSHKTIVVNGLTASSRENRSLWSLPVLVSLKFLI